MAVRRTALKSALPEVSRITSRDELRVWLNAVRKLSCWHDWKWQLAHVLETRDLVRMGLVCEPSAIRAANRYPARVTPYYAALSDWSSLRWRSDPLVRQWLPLADEVQGASRACDGCDPFDEAGHAPLPGVIRRFPDRIVVLAHACCATVCRYCTRRHILSHRKTVSTDAQIHHVVAYVRANPAIREVILSGGDPMLLSDAALLRLVRAFTKLPQIDAVRIGTRVPVMLPMRVTDALAGRLGESRRVWVNTQFNHVREITPESAAACGRLVDAGIPVSNQTVLLRGVNDSVDAMAALCAGLQRMRVRPYYAFVCDPVRGTHHFRTTRARARVIAAELAQRLGGLAVPRFVVDVPGASYKVGV